MFWIHLPKRELARRVKQADKRKGRRCWQIEDADRRILEHYDDALPWLQRFLRLTDWSEAPWTIVEGSDDRHRNLLVARTLLERLGKHLAARAAAPPPEAGGTRSPLPNAGRDLDRVDLDGCPRRITERSRSGRGSCTGGSTARARRGSPACSCSRAGTPPARAA
jgi:hypothetical protein